MLNISAVFLYFYFSVMFCDNYTLNTVTVYNLLIFFFISGSGDASFFNTIMLSNAEYELRYYVIYNIRKFSFKHMSYYKEFTLRKSLRKKVHVDEFAS